MAIGVIAGSCAVLFLFIVTPVADWADAATAGLRHRSLLPAVGGLLDGHLVATAIVAAGVAGLLAVHPTAMKVLTMAGVAYLIWIEVSPAIDPPTPTTGNGSAQDTVPGWRQAATRRRPEGDQRTQPQGPAAVPGPAAQFTDPGSSWPVSAQIGRLGAIHIAGCAAVGTGARRVLRVRPTAATIVGRISGTAMVLVGLVLSAEQTFR